MTCWRPALWLSIGLLASCGSPGEDGQDAPPPPTLSASRSDPGRFITVATPAIRAGTPVTVTFASPDGYSVDVLSTPAADGSLRVAVPPFLVPGTRQFAEGVVQVLVDGVAAPGEFAIGALPALEGTAPGAVYLASLRAILGRYQAARTTLASLAAEGDVAAAATRTDRKVERLEAMIRELEEAGRVTLTLDDGSTARLEGEDLRLLDRLLYATLTGVEEEMAARGALPAALVARDPASRVIRAAADGAIDPQQAVDNVLNGLQSGIEWGNVYLMGVAAGVGVIALLGGAEVVIVAGAAALAVSYVSTAFDIGASAAFNQMLASLESGAHQAYDLGEKLLDHAVDIASQWLPRLPGIAGALFEDVADALGISDAVESLWTLRCGTTQRSLKVQESLRQADHEDFCALFDPSAPPADGRFFASVSIPGSGYWEWIPGRKVSAYLVDFPGQPDPYPQILACSTPNCWGPEDRGPVNDSVTLTFAPDLACSHVYDLQERWDEVGVLAVFDSPNISPVTNLSSTSGTLTLTRFGTGIGSRLKGSFSAGIEGTHTACGYDGQCTRTTRTGRLTGTFDVVIEEPETTLE